MNYITAYYIHLKAPHWIFITVQSQMEDNLPRGCIGPECTFTECRTKEHLLYHVKCGIPTRLKYDDLGIVPKRQDFIDPKLRAIFAAQVTKGAPLIFMPNDIIEKNDRVDNQLKYRIYMTGVLPCGSRAMLILDGVEVHFDVMVPDDTTSAGFDDLLRGLLVGKNVPFTGIRTVQALKLKGFQKAPRPWKRITFDTLQDRKKGIDMIEAINRERADSGKPKFDTAADDCKRGASDYYFPKVARELRFATADWNRIEKYTAVPARTYSPNCDYVLRVNINNLKKLDKQKRDELKSPGHILAPVMDRDNTMVAQWDIETWRKVQNGMVPTPKDDDYVIFMLCAAYFWHHSNDPMMAVCCFHTTSAVRKGMSISIECANEKEALFAHMYVMGKMSPEILSAFNGQNFDWPLYREKLRRESLLVELKRNLSALTVLQNETEANVLKWCFTSTNIKIDAETKHHAECVAKFPGMIDIDVLPIFLKMYPKMEVRKSFSLNFFLQKNGLESKEDMHFKTMFKIYERARKLSERTAQYKVCHCDELKQFLTTRGTPTVWKPHCACCDKVPEIDCKKNPKFVPNGNEPEYLQDLHDDLISADTTGADTTGADTTGATTGAATGADTTQHTPLPKCCQCGKMPRNLNDMRDVAYYCTIDTIRPQQLCVKRAILPDKRELSTMSYVSLYDSFFRADGMKVRNVIGSYCHQRGIAFSNAGSGKTPEEKDHYPGAWVFPPERGLNATRPITGLDFASLYPSLMMAYNLSPDMVVYSRELAEALAAEGYSIHHIRPFNFERGEQKGSAANKHLTAEGWTVRHNGLFNPKKNKRAVTEYVKTIAQVFKITSAHELFSVATADIICGVVNIDSVSHNATESQKKTTTGCVIATDKSIDATTREIYIEYPERDGATSAQELVMQHLKSKGLKPARRVKYLPIEGRDPLPGERMGIFAFIVKKLFDKRVPIKAEFVRLSKLQEQMELAKTKVWSWTDAKGQECTTTMAEVKFQIAKVDSKQKALKVLANTFYGESGNYLSSIYELLVAAGITCAGQENIKKVAGFITGKGYGPRYGDTDSIYTTCPESVYASADARFTEAMSAVHTKWIGTPNVPEPTTDAEREYKAARVVARTEYWTEMVDITMKVMSGLKEEVSDFLLSDNGTCFLNMAYEEVGFPTVLCGKKKYYLTPHIETINFYPKDVFIRGIDIIKQGQTQISKKLGDEFMRESLSPANERELIEIAIDKIRKFYSMKLDPGMFALSAKYNPTKKNVPVLTFVNRVKEMQKKYAPGGATPNPTLYALYEPPEPGDKFTYVIVKKDQHFTLQGKRIEIKKGDQMEFMRVYNEFAAASAQGSSVPAMEIDMNYYVKNAIVGIFARFIAYHPRFQPPAGKYDPQDKDQYKQMDEFCVSAAGKYLEELCDSITGFDKTELKKRGQDYRTVYRRADKAIREELGVRYGAAAEILHSIDVHDTEEDLRARSTRIVEQIKQHCREEAKSLVGDNSEKYVSAMTAQGVGVFKLKRIYMTDKGGGMSKSMMDGYKRVEADCIDKLFKTVGPTSRIIYDYERRFIEIIDEMRAEGIADPSCDQIARVNALDEESEQNLETIHSLTMRLTCVYMLQERLKRLIEHIEKLRMKAINEPVDPKINPRELSKQEAKSSPVLDEFQWG